MLCFSESLLNTNSIIVFSVVDLLIQINYCQLPKCRISIPCKQQATVLGECHEHFRVFEYCV